MKGYEEKALATTTNSRAELNDIYGPMVISTLNDRTTFYGLLTKEQNDAGDYVRWRVRTGRNTSADSYGETDSITLGNTTRAKLSTAVKLLKVGVEVTGLMKEAAKSPSGIGDIWAKEIEDASKDFLVEINTQLFADGTGNSNKDLFGLKNTVDDGTLFANIYGLARATNTYLQSTTVDKSSANISLTDLRTMIRTSEEAGANKNDLMFVTSYKQKDKILDLLQDIQRLVPTSARTGFEGLPTFDGVPIHADAQCDDDYVYLLDMRHTKMKVTLSPVITYMGIDGDSEKAFIKMYAEFIAEVPTHNVKYYGFA